MLCANSYVAYYKIIAVAFFIAALFFSVTAAYAEVTLPDGAVKGLPEKITAMDSSGRSVNSSTGEYFFLAENMTFGEVYTKEIQLMNLCDDKAYNIYFSVEPKPESKKGEIDLEEGCVCSFYLDGEQFYNGSITGIGNIDLTHEAHDLGYYEPGDSHTLSCSIAWVNSQEDLFIDEVHKLIDKTGEWILTPREGDQEVDGDAVSVDSENLLSACINVNNDTAGWIIIPGTNIDFPIMQSGDNEFYLHNGADGYYNYELGCPFLDFRCEKDMSGFNSIVYGHHITYGRMFADIVRYEDEAFFDGHDFGYLVLPDKVRKVEFFAYLCVESDSPIYNAVFLTLEDCGNYIDLMFSEAEYSKKFTSDELKNMDDIHFLLLSTCTFGEGNLRSVLAGVF